MRMKKNLIEDKINCCPFTSFCYEYGTENSEEFCKEDYENCITYDYYKNHSKGLKKNGKSTL